MKVKLISLENLKTSRRQTKCTTCQKSFKPDESTVYLIQGNKTVGKFCPECNECLKSFFALVKTTGFNTHFTTRKLVGGDDPFGFRAILT